MMSPLDPVCIGMGHPRSGTSMLMHALMRGGMDAVYDKHRAMHDRRDLHPSGLWEFEACDKCAPYLWRAMDSGTHWSRAVPRIKRCGRLKCKMTLMAQPWRYAGRLVKVLLPSFEWPLIDWEGGYRVVMIWRPHAEVAASWNKAWGHKERYPTDAYRFRRAFDSTAESCPHPLTILNYADVVADPVGNFQRLADAGWPIDVAAASSVPDPKHYRNRVA